MSGAKTSRALLAGALVVLTAACSAETGVLIAVTGSNIEQLEFHVGVLDTEGDHVLLPAVSGERVSVRSRNLRAEPYELLLRKGEGVPAGALNVRVLALAYRAHEGEDRLVGFALTEPPQRFIDGEVVRRSIGVDGLDNRSINVHQDCVRVTIKEDHFDLIASDDRDCDGSVTSEDCKDSDPSIYPGATERCDGKDNNCDGKYAPRDQRCFTRVGEGDAAQCKGGKRVCLDAEGKGFEGDCQVTDGPFPMVFCEAYDRCGAACAERIAREELFCTVEVAPGDGGKQICPEARWTLSRPASAKGCSWRMINREGIEAKLQGKDGKAGEAIKACEPTVSLVAFGGVPAEGARATVVYGGDPGQVTQVGFKGVPVEKCSASPMRCE